jgi:glycosyltransferase involved in cell wall biosynthesis
LVKSFGAFLTLFISGQRFDVMSIHFSLEALLARFIRLFFGIPYVMVLAGDTPLELIEAKRANGKVQISHFMNNQCEKYGYKAEVIAKGIDLTRYNPNVPTTELRKKLDLGENKVILTMCRLDPRKNLITLLEAAKYLNDQHFLEDKIFVIAGDGVEKQYLQNQTAKLGLQKKVLFVGSVPNTSAEHPMYYAMSELFVLPTLYEGFGWVFLEAMACGVPIVTTQAGSNPEVVGDVGLLVPVKNPQLLAEAIVKVMTDTELRQRLRDAGLTKAQKFSWTSVAKKYDDYYTSVSKQKSNSISAKINEIGYMLVDAISILLSLFKDKVIFNSEVQNYNVTGQKGGVDGSL